MTKRFGRLPPLASLRGFEAAARLGSFSKAADELNMTQSAISHQIRVLEEFFEQPLFIRTNRTVELTDAGVDFMQTAVKTLDLLSDGVKRLEFYKKPGSVVIATAPGFASKWLVPRLPLLKEAYPEVDPWIIPVGDMMDLNHAEVDFVLWYGDGDWPGATVEKLFDDAVTPLYAPSLVKAGGAPATAADIARFPLFHDERREDWNAWFGAVGVENIDVISGINFSDFGLSLDAALAGQGAVLGSTILAASYLKSGELVMPFKTVLPTSDTYHMVYLPRHLARPAVKQFYDWLHSQLEAEQ